MKLKSHIALAVGCGLVAAVSLHSQSTPPAQQPKPPASTQQPANTQKPPTESNPFPEDTNNVPVVPTNGEPGAPPPPPPVANEGSAMSTSLMKSDSDPVHSPDDPLP